MELRLDALRPWDPDTAPPAGMVTLEVLSGAGDTCVCFDPARPEERQAADTAFDHLTHLGYVFFAATVAEPEEHAVKQIPRDATALIAVPQIRGGRP